jgi:thioredoxin
MVKREANYLKRNILLLAVCGIMVGSALARAASKLIYDEQADARRDIAAAISQASKTGRNIVLIFGANW